MTRENKEALAGFAERWLASILTSNGDNNSFRAHAHHVFSKDGTMCSRCGSKLYDSFALYCPQCGARLDGDD